MDYLKDNKTDNIDSDNKEEQKTQLTNKKSPENLGSSIKRTKKPSGSNIQLESQTSVDFNRLIKSPMIHLEQSKLQEICKQITKSQNEQQKQVYVLGISGGSSAGKSLLATLIKHRLEEFQDQNNVSTCIIKLSQTDFYHSQPKEFKQLSKEEQSQYLASKNFDVPDAIDWDYFIKCLKFVKAGNPVDVPVYNMENQSREKKTKKIKQKADIIIVEGTLVFNNQELRDLFDLKIFLDTDEDTRLSRRVYKDCCIRKKPLQNVITKYRKFTKESFEKYTFPTKKFADIVIPNFGGDYQLTDANSTNEYTAGFSSIDSGVVDVILSLLNNHITNSKKQENKTDNQSPNKGMGSPQLIAEKETIIYKQNTFDINQ